MSESKLRTQSMDFAVSVLNLKNFSEFEADGKFFENSTLQTAFGVLYYLKLCVDVQRMPITRTAEYARSTGHLGSPLWVFW